MVRDWSNISSDVIWLTNEEGPPMTPIVLPNHYSSDHYWHAGYRDQQGTRVLPPSSYPPEGKDARSVYMLDIHNVENFTQ
jgi:hypothetical protein